jgi:hypothetical protein
MSGKKAVGCLRAVVLLGALAVFMVPTGQAQLQFENVATRLGLDQTGSCGGPFWVDMDSDGDQDLLRMHRFNQPSILFRNDGLDFTALSATIGFPQTADAGGVNPMDFDHDGDLDLLVYTYGSNFQLLVNDNGIFTDRAEELGLHPRTGGRYRAWIDFNEDGWMDLLMDFTDGWKLYRNDNGTGFTDITATTGMPDIPDSYIFIESDIDLDGDVDLYVSVIGGPNHLYVNNGDGSFEDQTVAAGLGDIVGNGSCAWVDFNHDKYPDLITPDGNHHGVFINNGDRTFTTLTVHGTNVQSWGGYPQACLYGIADFDMDRDPDIYVCRPGGCGNGLAPNQFLRMDSISSTDIWFTDVAPDLGMDFEEDGYPCVVDYDGDGAMDLYIASQDHPDRLFHNITPHTADQMEVRVLGPTGDQDRWLSRVEVYQHGTDQVVSASELNSSNVARNGFKNYFVLDPAAHYDLKVYFTDGTSMLPADFPQLSDVVPSDVNHLLTVYKGQTTGTPATGVVGAGDFRLEAAYPNPFNSATTLRFVVPAACRAQLRVYDLLGQNVANLMDENVSAGEHQVTWNAAGVSSGVYFVSLDSGDRFARQKVLLLK